MKTLSCRLIIAFAGCVMLSSCTMQKSIIGKDEALQNETLDLLHVGKVYTFNYLESPPKKVRVKILYIDSLIVKGNIISSSRKGEEFEMTRQEVLKQIKSITTISTGKVITTVTVTALIILLINSMTTNSIFGFYD